MKTLGGVLVPIPRSRLLRKILAAAQGISFDKNAHEEGLRLTGVDPKNYLNRLEMKAPFGHKLVLLSKGAGWSQDTIRAAWQHFHTYWACDEESADLMDLHSIFSTAFTSDDDIIDLPVHFLICLETYADEDYQATRPAREGRPNGSGEHGEPGH